MKINDVVLWDEINNQILREQQEKLHKELVERAKEINERKFEKLESKDETR